MVASWRATAAPLAAAGQTSAEDLQRTLERLAAERAEQERLAKEAAARAEQFRTRAEQFERQAAKANKNFARADAIRDELAALGIVLKDSREGTTWVIEAP